MSEDIEQPITLQEISVAQLRMLEGRPALTETQLAQALVRFANDGSYHARWLVESGVDLPGAMFPRHGEAALPVDIHHRTELCDALDKIVKGNGKVSAPIAALWRRRACGLVLLRANGPGGENCYRWQPFEWWKTWPSAAVANALLVLLKKPCGRLCRCGLVDCGRFFFATRPPKPDRAGQKRGAPITEYCPDTDHRARARKIAARERMARLRADRAKAKQSKRRR